MTIETTTKFTNSLYAALSEFDDKVSGLARKFHADVITPFCEKFNVKFYVGNGCCFFQRLDTGENINDDDLDSYFDGDREDFEDDMSEPFWNELNDIFTVLNFEIYDGKFYYNY